MELENLRIRTERLILRPFTMDDVEPSFVMNLDPEVSRYTGDGGVVSKNEVERRIREQVIGDYAKYGYGRLAVERKDQPGFIGFCGLKYLPDLEEVDLGYRFIREHWGSGLATEAASACMEFGFGRLKLDRIIGMVLPDNKASIRVLQKLNFSFEKEMTEENMLLHLYAARSPG
jgi:RimJ/RimL family protein N-acetyltransferase